MVEDELLILEGTQMHSLLLGRERELLDAVETAYRIHSEGDSSLPHSNFLRFPGQERDRIIALPAYLGGEFKVGGIKWIASFPGNQELGFERASAVVILNCAHTGRPKAILEGSIISAKRTAASAAVASKLLQRDREVGSVGLIGCGLINFEIARFLLEVHQGLSQFLIYDQSVERAELFRHKCMELYRGVRVEIAGEVEEVLGNSRVISLATTALRPHIDDLSACPKGSLILHISLRDLTPEVILSADNIVDDVSHVCRAETSVHLAEQLTGNRDFIRCTLADVIDGSAPLSVDDEAIRIFSPFGLGVLDIAVSKLALDLALREGRGTIIKSFLPEPWTQRYQDQATSS